MGMTYHIAPSTTASGTGEAAVAPEGKSTETQQQSETPTLLLLWLPTEIANNTPILSILGNSTRLYPGLNSISTGVVDALHSCSNKGYFSRDVSWVDLFQNKMIVRKLWSIAESW
eukprot:scaffold1064_cov209-Skeletonema_marinoi.AAC.8